MDNIIRTKSITYCYPSSKNAKKFNSPNGCYLVTEWLGDTLAGPFATITEAENEAEKIEFPWEETYKKFAYNGSKFSKNSKF
jgi:hypothetical protein